MPNKFEQPAPQDSQPEEEQESEDAAEQKSGSEQESERKTRGQDQREKPLEESEDLVNGNDVGNGQVVRDFGDAMQEKSPETRKKLEKMKEERDEKDN